MSTLSQFFGGGGVKPTGLINGVSAWPAAQGAIGGFLNAYYTHWKAVLSGDCDIGTLRTVLSVSGKGALSFLAVQGADATSRTHRIKITLDGVVIYDATSSAVSATSVFTLLGAFIAYAANASYGEIVETPLLFDQSLLIEYASSLDETDKTLIGYKYYPR